MKRQLAITLALLAIVAAVASLFVWLERISPPELHSEVQHLWSVRSGRLVAACYVAPDLIATETVAADLGCNRVVVRNDRSGAEQFVLTGTLACSASHVFGFIVESNASGISFVTVQDHKLRKVGPGWPGSLAGGTWIRIGKSVAGAFDNFVVIGDPYGAEHRRVPVPTTPQLGPNGWRIAATGATAALVVCEDGVACVIDAATLSVQRVGGLARVPTGTAVFPSEGQQTWFAWDGAKIRKYLGEKEAWSSPLPLGEVRRIIGNEDIILVVGESRSLAIDGKGEVLAWQAPQRAEFLSISPGTELLYQNASDQWVALRNIGSSREGRLFKPRLGQYYDGQCNCISSFNMIGRTILVVSDGILDALELKGAL